MNDSIVKMVEEFQCPGCICGSDTECGSFKYDDGWKRCTGHTMLGLGNVIALGLPKGFNRPGWDFEKKEPTCRSKMEIRLWPKGEYPEWNHLNVPVWGMEQEGFLFVRTFCPRINVSYVDVVEDETIDLIPNAINVAAFIDDID